MDVDIQWERAEKYARQFAFKYFEIPDTRRVEKLRNNIFEYIRKRYLNLDYSESAIETKQYCFTCLEWLPKFHFC